MACGLLVSQPGIEPVFPALEVQNLNLWTTKEVPRYILNSFLRIFTEKYFEIS